MKRGGTDLYSCWFFGHATAISAWFSGAHSSGVGDLQWLAWIRTIWDPLGADSRDTLANRVARKSLAQWSRLQVEPGGLRAGSLRVWIPLPPEAPSRRSRKPGGGSGGACGARPTNAMSANSALLLVDYALRDHRNVFKVVRAPSPEQERRRAQWRQRSRLLKTRQCGGLHEAAFALTVCRRTTVPVGSMLNGAPPRATAVERSFSRTGGAAREESPTL
jgi:hypothetical protein